MSGIATFAAIRWPSRVDNFRRRTSGTLRQNEERPMSEQDDNQEDGFAEEKLIQAIENQIESENRWRRAPCSTS